MRRGRGAQIICLKELFNAPYFCKAQQCDRFDLAEPIPGPDHRADAGDSRASSRSSSSCRSSSGRRPASIATPPRSSMRTASLLGVYRKMHIPDDPLFNEKYYFTPGDGHLDYHGEHAGEANGFKVWKTRYATIGVLICWDQWYPEAARITTLLGAEVLFYPTAIGWHPAEKDEWGAAQVEAWRTIQRSHAIANGVYVASPNRIGHEDEPGTNGITFFGHSFIADPFGRYVAEAGDEEEIAHRAVRPGADRIGPAQLAVPARPPRRRVRPDPQPLSRNRRTPKPEHEPGSENPEA